MCRFNEILKEIRESRGMTEEQHDELMLIHNQGMENVELAKFYISQMSKSPMPYSYETIIGVRDNG